MLLVIIPEKLAEWVYELSLQNFQGKLPKKTKTWQTIPELKLATMSLQELRGLAKRNKLIGYSADNKEELSQRLLRSLKQKATREQTLLE